MTAVARPRVADGVAQPPVVRETSRPVALAMDPLLRELYQAHGGAVTRRLHRLCGDAEVAADLCQDTFLVAMSKRDQLDDVRARGAWLHAIAYNLLRDHRRAHARKQGLWRRWFGRSPEPAPALTANVGDDEAQLAHRLDEALQALGVDQRDAFVLRQVEGLSLAEAAELLGVSVQTVSHRAKRAEQELRAAFEAS